MCTKIWIAHLSRKIENKTSLGKCNITWIGIRGLSFRYSQYWNALTSNIIIIVHLFLTLISIYPFMQSYEWKAIYDFPQSFFYAIKMSNICWRHANLIKWMLQQYKFSFIKCFHLRAIFSICLYNNISMQLGHPEIHQHPLPMDSY
jgi:hypothetical protein